MKTKERENARRAVQGRVAPDEIIQNNASAAVVAAVVKRIFVHLLEPLFKESFFVRMLRSHRF